MSPSTLQRDVSARTGRLVTRAASETRALGAALAAAAMAGDRIALIGDLGTGKTQFAKGFAEGLGVTEVVDSPSFTLMAEYTGRLPLFHQDLYRLDGAAEILASGLLDERQDEGVTLSEWADRLDARLDPHRLELRFAFAGEDGRIIESRCADDDRHERYLRAARAWEPAARREMSLAGGPWLAIDTATQWTIVAVGEGGSATANGRDARTSTSLLDMIDRTLGQAGCDRGELGGVVIGTGPGSFTGLRVGSATAKTLAHELGIAIMGVTTAEALARSAVTDDPALVDLALALTMPAGARDQYLTRLSCDADHCLAEPTQLVPMDADLTAAIGTAVPIAVGGDPASTDPGALERGAVAVDGLGAALLAICASRLRRGHPVDDAVTLVPAYAALPRGLEDTDQGMGWSPDLR